jgi:hypothetical protein
VACHDWRSVISVGQELLSKADLRQFKALCDNDYISCKGEYYLYKDWAAMIMAKPKYIAIMSGLTSEEDEVDEEHHFNDGSDNNCRQAYFLAHHQLLAIIVGSFHPQEAALF